MVLLVHARCSLLLLLAAFCSAAVCEEEIQSPTGSRLLVHRKRRLHDRRPRSLPLEMAAGVAEAPRRAWEHSVTLPFIFYLRVLRRQLSWGYM